MGIGVRTGLLGLLTVLCVYSEEQLRFCVRADPKTFDPLLASEEVSDTIRFLTGGVLIRFNRQTQRLDPELATSWKIVNHAQQIDFELRTGVTYSDGAPFGPADVAATI